MLYNVIKGGVVKNFKFLRYIICARPLNLPPWPLRHIIDAPCMAWLGFEKNR